MSWGHGLDVSELGLDVGCVGLSMLVCWGMLSMLGECGALA